jgi:ectoine hydroxylase-related dioxygenase (phytanoyl-CoA dioxygenase family)
MLRAVDVEHGWESSLQMLDFTDSSSLIGHADELRARFEEDGYLLLRGVVATEPLLEARRAITDVLERHGWLQPGTDPMDAIPQVEPRVEGEPLFFEVYDDVQRLEAFHAVPHDPTVQRCLTPLLGEDCFPHPLGIARISFPDSDEWTTPPHQDFPNNQGTTELIACWLPLSDCPVTLGPLSILRGSHRLGLLPLEPALGPGLRQAKLDERAAALDWVGGDLHVGDALVFHSLTVHRALPNQSDRLRLSVDYRFQAEGAALTEGCLQPHFGRLDWDEIYAGWKREDLKYYWRSRRYEVASWDDGLFALADDAYRQQILEYMRWRTRHGGVPVNLQQGVGAGR